MYSTLNNGTSAITAAFVRTIKIEIYKYMTSTSKKVILINDVVNKYNITYHTSIKMKPVDVKSKSYIASSKKLTMNILNLKSCFCFKNIKVYTPNWSQEVLVIKKVKMAVPWTYVTNDLIGEETVGTFYQKELQKARNLNWKINQQKRWYIICLMGRIK